jgi:hypothetical protein
MRTLSEMIFATSVKVAGSTRRATTSKAEGQRYQSVWERKMLIILCLYVALVWLVFSKLKLLKWGWATGSFTVFVGEFMRASAIVTLLT